MKSILTIVAVAFAMTLGACCTKTSCPPKKDACCAADSKTCDAKPHVHAKKK